MKKYVSVSRYPRLLQLEPLSLPLTGWVLPGQLLSLLAAAVIFVLYLSLTFLDKFYSTITIVVFINLLQQSLQVGLTYVLATDLGFCCPGISFTRWFIHQDFYTKVNSRTTNDSRMIT